MFALKFAVILYFAACTSIDHYTIGKTVTPVVTRGVWKVDLLKGANKGKSNDLSGYTFTFNSSGILTASKNGVDVTGNWFEDDITNRMTIKLDGTDPSLTKLNAHWNIREISNEAVQLQDDNSANNEKLDITML